MYLGGRRSIVSTQNPKTIAGKLRFLLIWCGLFGVMFYAWAIEAGNIFGGLFAGFFLLMGLVMLWDALCAKLEYARFGEVRLTIGNQLPAIGRQVPARIDLPEKAAAAGHIDAELACIRVTYTRKGATGEDAWSEKRRIPIQRTERGGTAFMRIDVPEALFPTDVPDSDGASPAIDFDRAYYRWELRVVGEVEGLDLQRTFDVRVLSAVEGAASTSAGSPVGAAPPPVTGVNPVIAMGRDTPGAAALRSRNRRKLAAAGFMVVAGVAAILFLHSGSLEPPPGRVSVPDASSALREPRADGAVDLQVGPEATEFVALQAGNVLNRLREAVIAQAHGRHAEAEQLFETTLAAVEIDHGDTSVQAALVHHRISVMYLRQRRHVEQEQALLRALAILERYSDAEVKAAPGMQDQPLDVEMILADLAYAVWEQRRYDQAFVWYQRAYEAAANLDVDEWNRNRRLAVSSAGLMASACTQRKWDVADRAMAELKERMDRVDAELRKWLDYWVRTGEPRLAARKC